MITLRIECSMCGKEHPNEISGNTKRELDLERIKRVIEERGWIFQINGDNIDTYCSKKCAI